jgi:hypothetical protein
MFANVVKFSIAVSVAVLMSIQWFGLLEHYFMVRVDFKNRDKLHHDLSLFSETGFYYSFYEQFVFAKDWQSGLDLLYNDTLSEYPDSVNALVRVCDPHSVLICAGVGSF